MRKKIIIDGKETNYEVSDDGKIYNIKFNRELKGTHTTNEYHSVALSINGKPRSFLVHRLVAQAFCENPNNYNIVDHINQDKYDNRACNLRWATSVENALNVERKQKSFSKAYWKDKIDSNHWKTVPNHSDYLISDMGVIINKQTKLILRYTDRHGYKRIGLQGKTYGVHLLVWRAFVGEIPKGLQIDHINGIRDDNRLENLRLVSGSENMKNSYANGHVGAVEVYQFDENGTFIKKYNSFHEAAQVVKGNEVAIKDASNRKGMSSGFYWLRAEDKDNIENIIVNWVPEGFKIIPILPTYCVNKEGKVYNKRTKNFTTIHYFADGTHPYIKKKGIHYQIEDLLKQTWKKN